MKNRKSFKLLQIALLFLAACAPSYLGKTYSPTQNVDIYLDQADIKKPYTIMGNTETEVMLKTTERTQQELIDLAKAKGADGIILSSSEEVTSTTASTSGTDKKGRKENEHNSTTTTSTSKTKKIKGVLIKYN
jgi:ABC-type sugar transport system substrate-binding protein